MLSDCLFPTEWSGKWFQYGKPGPVVVNSTHLLDRKCVDKNGDTFLTSEEKWVPLVKYSRPKILSTTLHQFFLLLFSSSESSSCMRCMIVTMRAENVIQYRECEYRFCLAYFRLWLRPSGLREARSCNNNDSSARARWESLKTRKLARIAYTARVLSIKPGEMKLSTIWNRTSAGRLPPWLQLRPAFYCARKCRIFKEGQFVSEKRSFFSRLIFSVGIGWNGLEVLLKKILGEKKNSWLICY